MWRSNIDSDWERKKEYLVKSLFQDVPLLSPVPEEDESFDLSGSRIYRSPVFAPRRVRSRSASPLPPLIIEKEPNRHDEPEEFYQRMEKRVLRVYRKLFIEGKSDMNDISSSGYSDPEDVDTDYTFDFEVQITSSVHDGVNEPYSHPDEIVGIDHVTDNFEEQISSKVHDISNESSTDLDQISIEKNNERSGLKRTILDKDEDASTSKSKKSKSTKTTSSSTEVSPKCNTDDDEAMTDSMSSDEHEAEDNAETAVDNNTPPTDCSVEVLQVTFKADVHRDAEYEFVKPSSVVYERADNIVEEATNYLEDVNDGEATLENNTVSGKSIHHGSSDATEILEEIEVMRVQPIRPSAGSLHNGEHTASADEITMVVVPRAMERQTESVSPNDRDPVSMESDINLDLLRRSSVVINCDNREDVSRRFGSNSTSSSSVGNSMCSRADAGVQTPFNHGIIDIEILRDMVVGILRAARICTCANHSCTR